MKKAILILALVLLHLARLATADEAAIEGRVSVYRSSEGVIHARFMPGAEIDLRDVFTVAQRGKVIGEAMVVKVNGDHVTLLLKGVFKGTPKVGDIVRFARHAEMPLDGTESWKRYESPDKRFSVIVPSPPAASASRRDTSDGPVEITSYTTLDPSDRTLYKVSIEVYRRLKKLGENRRYADTETQLNYFIKLMSEQKKAKVRWSRRVDQGKLPGREFEMEETGLVLRGRIYWLDATIYYAMAITEGSGVSSRAVKFLNSFKINPPK